MLTSSLCDHSDAYTFVRRTITINRTGSHDNAKQLYETKKKNSNI